MIPRPADGGPLRLVHRSNTLAGIADAVARGFGIELDVIGHDGRPVLAHSPEELEHGAPLLADALERAGDAFVLVDLKQAGIESLVVEALRGRGGSAVCGLDPAALRTVKRLDPALTTSISYPADRMKVSERGLPGPVLTVAAAALRSALPFRIDRMLTRSGADAATLHHLVLSPRTIERCRARGAAVIAWTVNDPAELERVLELGVDGVVTDDPLIF